MSTVLLISSLLFLKTSCLPLSQHQSSIPPYQTTLDLISEKGYASEKHTVESDGYQLELHRILTSGQPHGVVLLNHGFLTDSACWVYGKIEYSIAEY